MSGRAGRRGLDSTGLVIVAFAGDAPPDVSVSEKILKVKICNTKQSG